MRLLWYFLVLAYFRASVAQNQVCTTPNGEEATCVSVTDCPVFVSAITSQDPFTQRFVNASMCPGLFKICCGTSANYTHDPDKPTPTVELSVEEKRAYAKKHILPTTYYCGKQHTDDYFYNETETSVDEFPWMVYIISQNQFLNSNNKFEQNIGVGALISPQFIVSMDQNYKNAAVKIGQHHILKDQSCIPTSTGENDCTESSSNIPIVQKFRSNDSTIVLLKLGKIVDYTDYIRPICLPYEEFQLPSAGETLITSGWGTEQFIDGQHIQVKKRILHRMLKPTSCQRGNPIPTPICGHTFRNSSTHVCPEDNGGPLMYKTKKNWVAEGIVSGSTTCAKHQPVSGEIITKEKINWILDVVYANTNIPKNT